MINLALYPVPDHNWQSNFDRLLSDSYVKTKYNRTQYIKDKLKYIDDFLPEVKSGNLSILDLGPGFGEFLEVCRYFNNKTVGIDAPLNDSEMGNEYISLANLLTTRQKLDVRYVGFENIVLGKSELILDEKFDIINSQGSFEQIFKDYLEGEPHKVHKNCNFLSWKIDEKLEEAFHKCFSAFTKLLNPNGIVLIFANGAKNTKDYNNLLVKIAEENGFEIVLNKLDRLHKMRKK